MTLRIGDTIRVLSSSGFYHYGIYIGPWGGYRDRVVHNAKFEHVQITTFEAFAGGRPVEIVEPTVRTPWEAAQIVARVLSLVGRQYDLVTFNCEHLVTYAITGHAASPAVRGVMTVATLVGIALLGRGGPEGAR